MHSKRPKRIAMRAFLLGLSTSLSSVAWAQTAVPISIPPVRSLVDENGIDLLSNQLLITAPEVSIGTSSSGLDYTRYWSGDGWRNNFALSVTTTSTSATVTLGGSSSTFNLSGSVYNSAQGDGSTLTATASTFTYMGRTVQS